MNTYSLLLLALAPLSAQTFYQDDPLRQEPAPRDASKAVPRKISDYYDFLNQTFRHPGEPAKTGTTITNAMGANTLGEPMDGAWYTHRHYFKPMSREELMRGPGNTNAPAADQAWTVVKAKSERITPGFEVVDSAGRRYVLKFDAPEFPELATAPDVITSKFFYALGYHVPENYIVYFTAEQLKLGKNVNLIDGKGKVRMMTERDLKTLLAKVHQDSDGQYRALASLYLTGKPMGPFKYFDTRKDDPNDITPHEHHRELRGLRVFAAWLGHDDSRAINTLDMLVNDGGSPYIRHHLIDFGSTLGSATSGPNSARAGFEYMFQWKPAMKQFFTAGLLPPKWASANYSDEPALGRFEAEKFDPVKWMPEYPNPAFSNMLPEDAFWAAKQVMAFRDEEIRAIVKTGRYSDPTIAETVSKMLIQRRDKIGRAFLAQILPLDEFRVSDKTLTFRDLEVDHGFRTGRRLNFQWFSFDNRTGQSTALVGEQSAMLPQNSAAYLICEITNRETDKSVQVYVRTSEVVGIVR